VIVGKNNISLFVHSTPFIQLYTLSKIEAKKTKNPFNNDIWNRKNKNTVWKQSGEPFI
jgi:hypothetical protein